MILRNPFGSLVLGPLFWDNISPWFPCMGRPSRKNQLPIAVISGNFDPPCCFLVGLLELAKGFVPSCPICLSPHATWRSFPDASASAPAEAGFPWLVVEVHGGLIGYEALVTVIPKNDVRQTQIDMVQFCIDMISYNPIIWLQGFNC